MWTRKMVNKTTVVIKQRDEDVLECTFPSKFRLAEKSELASAAHHC